MTERLAKKKRIRAGHKASTTTMLSEVDALLAEGTPEHANQDSSSDLRRNWKQSNFWILNF